MKRQIRARDNPPTDFHPLYDLIHPLITSYTFWFFFGLVFIVLSLEMLLEVFGR